MTSMSEMDGDTKRDWLKWELDTLQAEWEQQQVLRMSAEHTTGIATEAADDTLASGVHAVNGRLEWHGQECSVLCWRCDAEAEYAGFCEAHYCDHLDELAEDDLQAHDEWVEEAYAAEELERAMREAQEARDDH